MCKLPRKARYWVACLRRAFNPELVILSDGAGQFAILLHALCWIHAERLIHKLIPVNDQQRGAIALVRDQVWSLYAELKAYKVQPKASQVALLEQRFDATFNLDSVVGRSRYAE